MFNRTIYNSKKASAHTGNGLKQVQYIKRTYIYIMYVPNPIMQQGNRTSKAQCDFTCN